MKPEIEGAAEACKICSDEKKPFCYVLNALKQLGLYYKGKCGRDTETGIVQEFVFDDQEKTP